MYFKLGKYYSEKIIQPGIIFLLQLVVKNIWTIKWLPTVSDLARKNNNLCNKEALLMFFLYYLLTIQADKNSIIIWILKDHISGGSEVTKNKYLVSQGSI